MMSAMTIHRKNEERAEEKSSQPKELMPDKSTRVCRTIPNVNIIKYADGTTIMRTSSGLRKTWEPVVKNDLEDFIPTRV